MKKYIFSLLFIVAVVIVEKENNIFSKVLDKLSPKSTPQSPLQIKGRYLASPELEVNLKVKLPLKNVRQPSEVRKHVLIFATTRSGSSFVGEIFNQHGNEMFYLFEPLWNVQQRLESEGIDFVPEEVLTKAYRDALHQLFLCNFSMLDSFEAPQKGLVKMTLFRPESSQSLCSYPACTPFVTETDGSYECHNQSCGPLDIRIASQVCLQKKYHAIKSVRIERLETLRSLTEDPRLDLKVIHLVRDPRAILASRMMTFAQDDEEWRKMTEDGDITEDDNKIGGLRDQCESIRMAAEVGLKRPPWLNGRYMLVRFEDIALFPMRKAAEMYQFTGIPFTDQVKEWLLQNTQTPDNEDDMYSTKRNSSQQAEKWRFNLPLKYVKIVQKVCGPTMKLLGYRFIESKEMLIDKSVSLIEDRVF
ncbi:carbohydrate sulfotransferase 3-like [Clarias gariepinus]|uniref:carbohydrate sulfotransferase 3-like n=1 Tax=Clarias gariepinus TaxID=13013 RepID=UPI00234D9945|nr:carbohydrate sulfotransferase 3-like [Clarias gariepinus]